MWILSHSTGQLIQRGVLDMTVTLHSTAQYTESTALPNYGLAQAWLKALGTQLTLWDVVLWLIDWREWKLEADWYCTVWWTWKWTWRFASVCLFGWLVGWLVDWLLLLLLFFLLLLLLPLFVVVVVVVANAARRDAAFFNVFPQQQKLWGLQP